MQTSQTTSQPQNVAQLAYAGFWIRAVAAAIDSIVLLGLFAVFGSLAAGFNDNEVFLDNVFSIAVPVCYWLYYGVFESSPWQATVGKKILSLKVVDVRCHRLGFFRATARWFLKILSSLPLGLGFALAGGTPRKQALHDLIGRTMVVYDF